MKNTRSWKKNCIREDGVVTEIMEADLLDYLYSLDKTVVLLFHSDHRAVRKVEKTKYLQKRRNFSRKCEMMVLNKNY